jgi:hypothetical protein
MTGPQQVEAFNSMAGKLRAKGVEITPVKRFKNHSIGTERCNKLEARLLSISPPKIIKKANGHSSSKPKFGHDKTIIHIEPNPRFKGTKAHGLYEAMIQWVEKNPGGLVLTLIDETGYRRQDYQWDLERGHIKVSSANQ